MNQTYNPLDREHISYSELIKFVNFCQWRWKLDVLECRRENDYSIHMIFGNAIHNTLEIYKNKDKEKRISEEEALNYFEKIFLEERENNLDKLSESHQDEKLKDNLLLSGKKIIENIKDVIQLNDSIVVQNEYKLYVPISRKDKNLNFKGYIDLIIKIQRKNKTLLFLCDYKTCSWGWNKDKRTDPYVLGQLTLYKHFLCKELNLDPKNVRTAFILLKKNPPNNSDVIEWFEYSSGPKTVQRALNILNESITRMRSGNYSKNKSSCIDKYGNKCPYYKTSLCE